MSPTASGHEAVTMQLLAVRCNVDLKTNNGFPALQAAEGQGRYVTLLAVRCNVDLRLIMASLHCKLLRARDVTVTIFRTLRNVNLHDGDGCSPLFWVNF
jgi:hypothetical protein